MKLRAGEPCPIPAHKRSRTCCGRGEQRKPETKKDWTLIAPGIYRIEDVHHPRGYRIRRSKAAMRTLLLIQTRKQKGQCCICRVEFIDITDIVPEHRDPRGAGGAWRDDHEDNIGAAHSLCNMEKGSKRIA